MKRFKFVSSTEIEAQTKDQAIDIFSNQSYSFASDAEISESGQGESFQKLVAKNASSEHLKECCRGDFGYFFDEEEIEYFKDKIKEEALYRERERVMRAIEEVSDFDPPEELSNFIIDIMEGTGHTV